MDRNKLIEEMKSIQEVLLQQEKEVIVAQIAELNKLYKLVHIETKNLRKLIEDEGNVGKWRMSEEVTITANSQVVIDREEAHFYIGLEY